MSLSSFFSKVFDAISNFFANIPWSGIFEFLKFLFIFLDAILFIGLILVFLKAWEHRPDFMLSAGRSKRGSGRLDPASLRTRWEKIVVQAEVNPPQSYSLAIIEADKFVDDVLKKMGLPGEHMADRLERLNNDNLRTLDKVWRVHRIRNELVHSPDFNISSVDTKDILGVYQKFLEELGAI